MPRSSSQTSCGRIASAGDGRRYGSVSVSGPARPAAGRRGDRAPGRSAAGRRSREVPWAIRRSRLGLDQEHLRQRHRATDVDRLAAGVQPRVHGRAGRRNDIDSSAVVYGVAAGSSVWIEHPNAMSDTIASVPPPIDAGRVEQPSRGGHLRTRGPAADLGDRRTRQPGQRRGRAPAPCPTTPAARARSGPAASDRGTRPGAPAPRCARSAARSCLEPTSGRSPGPSLKSRHEGSGHQRRRDPGSGPAGAAPGADRDPGGSTCT